MSFLMNKFEQSSEWLNHNKIDIALQHYSQQTHNDTMKYEK